MLLEEGGKKIRLLFGGDKSSRERRRVWRLGQQDCVVVVQRGIVQYSRGSWLEGDKKFRLLFGSRKILSDERATMSEFVEVRVCGVETARVATNFVKALVGAREKKKLTASRWWENSNRVLDRQMNCPLS